MHDGAAKIEPEVEFEVMMNQFSTTLGKFIATLEKITRFSDTFIQFSFDAQLQTWDIIPFRIGFSTAS